MSNVSKSTSRYLIRVEGVNMDAYIFNTNDLNAVRGAGLSLLNAVKDLKKSGAPLEHASCISQGASSGLFEVASQDIDQTLNDVRMKLNQLVPHGTFVAAAVPYAESKSNFRLTVEKLIALNRWYQAMAGSLSVPDSSCTPADGKHPACALEGTRIATEQDRLRGGKRWISPAISRQRKYGKDQKQAFYKPYSPDGVELLFANSFEEIAFYEDKSVPLNNKMAVFYADGNSFGQLQQDTCKGAKLQSKFDDTVRRQRENFLKDFLKENHNHSEWVTPQATIPGKVGHQEVFRFETLMWGGDEFMFVMPAALGWSFATHFFKSFQNAEFEGKEMTYTAAMVYCHHHAPIRRMKDLVKNGLAETAKDRGGREQHQLIVHSLESYDHLGENVETGLKELYKGLVEVPELILKPMQIIPLNKKLETIKETVALLRSPGSTFARSQLRNLFQLMLDQPADALDLAKVNGKNPRGAVHAFRNSSRDEREALENFLKLFPEPGGSPASWLHLEELWDYAR